MATVSFTSAIDIHAHFDSGTPYDHPGTNEMLCCTPDFIVSEYKAVNIVIGAVSSYASVTHREPVYDENIRTAQFVSDKPGFFYWVVIDPRNPGTYEQAKVMLSDPKCLGVKIHPGNHSFTIEEYGDALFSFGAQQHTTVLMHPCSNLSLISDMANHYPECRIMVAHLSSPSFVDCMRNAKYGNVVTDTSGGGIFLNNVLEYAVAVLGSECIMFGTDTGYSAAAQRGRIEFSRISEDAKRDILYRNALRLFPKLQNIYAKLM